MEPSGPVQACTGIVLPLPGASFMIRLSLPPYKQPLKATALSRQTCFRSDQSTLWAQESNVCRLASKSNLPLCASYCPSDRPSIYAVLS